MPTDGVDLSRYGPDEMMTMQQYNLFPNITVLVFGDLLQVVRARPGATPDDGYMDIIAFDRVNPDAARREPVTAEMETRFLQHGSGDRLGRDQPEARPARASRTGTNASHTVW